MVAGIKEIDGAPVGDTITLEARPCARAAAGLQADPAARVRRLVSGQLRGLRELPRRARQAQAQRLGAALRAGGLHGARVRLSLRLSRAAAHGHRAGAAGARILARPGHQRTDRGLRARAHRRQRRVRRQSGQAAAVERDRRAARADHHRQHPGAARLRRRRAWPVQREARRAEENAVPRHPGIAAVRAAAGRGGAGFLRSAQIRRAAAMPRSIMSSAVSRPRRW